MRVAFIEPAIANVEPMGIAYLAQSIINAGHEARYFEATRQGFFGRLKDFGPEVLAYSVTTGKHRSCRNLNSILRKHFNAISLFGGAHCTFYPEFIESDELIDGVCRGEGDYALVELLNGIERKEDYTDTPNWYLRIDGKIHKNKLGKLLDNLDNSPFPNREIIYSENADLRNTPIKRVFGARGCPFACSYCFNKKYNEMYKGLGKIYRSRSPQSIVKEIHEIRERYPLTFVKFGEDIFGMNMDCEEFAELYSREVGLPFVCNMRPNLMNEQLAKSLKKAGCVAVTMAVESGNEVIRNKVLNRNVSDDQIAGAIGDAKNEGLRVWTQNIIGNPGETFENAMETYKLNLNSRVDFGECNILQPFPGTDIYRYCIENNYFDGEVDTLQKSTNVDSSLRFESERDRRRITNFQKFFSLCVKHPFVLPIVKLLIELPPNDLFVLFNRLHHAWRVSRVLKAQFSIGNFIGTVRTNVKYILSYYLKSSEDWHSLLSDIEKESGTIDRA